MEISLWNRLALPRLAIFGSPDWHAGSDHRTGASNSGRLWRQFFLSNSVLKSFRWPRCGFFIAHVARRTRHPGGTAIAAVRALPRPSRVVLANPPGVFTEDAFHSASNPIGRLGGGDMRD